jgi:hypothetical protein
MPFKFGNKNHKLSTNGIFALHPSLCQKTMEIYVPSDYFWTGAANSGAEEQQNYKVLFRVVLLSQRCNLQDR